MSSYSSEGFYYFNNLTAIAEVYFTFNLIIIHYNKVIHLYILYSPYIVYII